METVVRDQQSCRAPSLTLARPVASVSSPLEATSEYLRLCPGARAGQGDAGRGEGRALPAPGQAWWGQTSIGWARACATGVWQEEEEEEEKEEEEGRALGLGVGHSQPRGRCRRRLWQS